jgi:23S rRNA-/tRNA-specific pseudouridylate synthase
MHRQMLAKGMNSQSINVCYMNTQLIVLEKDDLLASFPKKIVREISILHFTMCQVECMI